MLSLDPAESAQIACNLQESGLFAGGVWRGRIAQCY
jgi:hypothetical protein